MVSKKMGLSFHRHFWKNLNNLLWKNGAVDFHEIFQGFLIMRRIIAVQIFVTNIAF